MRLHLPSPSAVRNLVVVAAALFLVGCEYADILTSPQNPYGGGYSAPVGPGYGGGYQSGYGGGYPVFTGPGYQGGYGGYAPHTFSRIRIHSARWQSDRRGADVTGIVQEMLDRGIYSFKADNRTFGIDPDKGHHKRLHVRYFFRGESRTLVANEGETVRFR